MLDGAPLVPEGETGEEVESVTLHHFDGKHIEIKREQLIALNLGALLLSWRDDDGKIHRVMGVPLETVSRVSSIIKPF